MTTPELPQSQYCLEQKTMASVVAEWINAEAAQGNMLPVNKDSVCQSLINSDGQLVSQEGIPIAYGKLRLWGELYKDIQAIEIGSLIVHPDYRYQGWGIAITNQLLEKAAWLKNHKPWVNPAVIIFMLAENKISQALAQKIGGIVISKSSLPSQVWDLCFDPETECAHISDFPSTCPCEAFDLTHIAIEGEALWK